MKNLFPSTPEQDLAALKAMANAPVQQTEQKVNYLQESAKVNEGSLPMDKDYSVSDFAKLAGVQSTSVKEDTFSTAIAHIDKELDAGDPMLAATALQRAVNGDTLTTTERKELAPYLDLFKHLITDPGMRLRILSMAELLNKKSGIDVACGTSKGILFLIKSGINVSYAPVENCIKGLLRISSS